MARDFTLADVLGIIAIVVAIIGLIFSGLTGIVLGIVAIVLAYLGMYLVRDANRKNIFCIIGLILGIICLIVGIVILILHLTHVPPGQAKK